MGPITKENCNYFPLIPFMGSSVRLFLCIASYLVAIFYNRTFSFVPQPSDLTKQEPSAGIMNLSWTISSMLMFCVVLLRYIQINNVYPRKYRTLNMISLLIGIVGLIATMASVVYSVLGAYKFVHFPAMCISYISSSLYMTTQSHISYNMEAFYNRCIVGVRIACSILALCDPIAYTLAKLLIPIDNNWHHYVSAGCEWFMHLLFIVYIFTFCADFNQVKFRSYVVGDISNQTGSFRSNYVDYLRSQARARRRVSEGDSQIKYQNSTLL